MIPEGNPINMIINMIVIIIVVIVIVITINSIVVISSSSSSSSSSSMFIVSIIVVIIPKGAGIATAWAIATTLPRSICFVQPKCRIRKVP